MAKRTESLPPVRVREKLKEALEDYADRDGFYLSEYIRDILERHVKRRRSFDAAQKKGTEVAEN